MKKATAKDGFISYPSFLFFRPDLKFPIVALLASQVVQDLNEVARLIA